MWRAVVRRDRLVTDQRDRPGMAELPKRRRKRSTGVTGTNNHDMGLRIHIRHCLLDFQGLPLGGLPPLIR